VGVIAVDGAVVAFLNVEPNTITITAPPTSRTAVAVVERIVKSGAVRPASQVAAALAAAAAAASTVSFPLQRGPSSYLAADETAVFGSPMHKGASQFAAGASPFSPAAGAAPAFSDPLHADGDLYAGMSAAAAEQPLEELWARATVRDAFGNAWSSITVVRPPVASAPFAD
jgi:hypothetical protein